MNSVKLNIGCGTDYMEGFINIDGSTSLTKIDLVFELGKESLLDHFKENTVDYILANDIIEHHFHWEAVEIMSEFYKLLKNDGKCEIRVPDCEYIIKKFRMTVDRKLTLLFGGQDIPQSNNTEMEQSRKQFPEFFCHKYGWTKKKMYNDLTQIGFKDIKSSRAGTNFITIAKK